MVILLESSRIPDQLKYIDIGVCMHTCVHVCVCDDSAN